MRLPLKLAPFCIFVLPMMLLGLGLFPALSLGGIGQQPAGLDNTSVKTMVAQDSSQRLIGTAVGRDPVRSFAVIEYGENRHQRIFREGDQIDRILIKEIHSDRIIIDSGSGEQVMKLRRSGVTPYSRSTLTAAKTAKLNPAYRSGPRDRHYLIDSEEVAAAFADFETTLGAIDLGPGNLFNQKRGVRVKSFAPESIFAAMGLRNGDLILSINDQEITGTGEAVSVLQTMFEAAQADLKVRRRARTYRIHLQAE